MLCGLGLVCPGCAAEVMNNTTRLTTRSDTPADNPLIAGTLNNSAFHSSEFRHDWLIDGLMVADEPMVVAGPSKSMKTAILVDAAVSLAAGRSFLGEFQVSAAVPVYVISAESGAASLQARMRHVCQAKDINPKGLPIQWYTRVETLSTVQGCRNLGEALRHFGSKVVILDPTYLLLGGEVTADAAGNMFLMGMLLARIGTTCLDAGATCIVATHANSQVKRGKPMELPHIAWSGFQQWARQWWLLSRIQDYRDDGKHTLYLRYGGSAGHTGLLSLSIDEGMFEGNGFGKKWDVTVADARQLKRAADQEKAADANRKLDANCDAVQKA